MQGLIFARCLLHPGNNLFQSPLTHGLLQFARGLTSANAEEPRRMISSNTPAPLAL